MVVPSRPMWRHRLKRAVFEGLARTRLRNRLLFRYDFMFEPQHLRHLLNLVDDALTVPGNFAEIGCAYGLTTVWIGRHLNQVGAVGRRYFAVDTFGGFTAADISEEKRRGREAEDFGYEDEFRVNSLDLVRRTLELNDVDGVELIQADANTFDFARCAPLAFCLIDVDLYRPVLNALTNCIDHVGPGGVIVVDDCNPDVERWRGGYEAFTEFTQARGLPTTIEVGKLGVIRIPS